MTNAEKFIQDYTRNCSNQSEWQIQTPNKSIMYVQPWLTPDDARKAVEIARKEMIERACEYLEPKIWTMNMGDRKSTDECIEDFKQAMKDE